MCTNEPAWLQETRVDVVSRRYYGHNALQPGVLAREHSQTQCARTGYGRRPGLGATSSSISNYTSTSNCTFINRRSSFPTKYARHEKCPQQPSTIHFSSTSTARRLSLIFNHHYHFHQHFLLHRRFLLHSLTFRCRCKSLPKWSTSIRKFGQTKERLLTSHRSGKYPST
jgi:hypothetical protein